MSIKKLVRKKLAAWLSDEESNGAQSENIFKQGVAGDLTIESSLCGRLAVYSGLDQKTQACLLTGAVGSDAVQLRKMLEVFFSDLKGMKTPSADGIREVAKRASDAAGDKVVTYQHLFDAAEQYCRVAGPQRREIETWMAAFASLRDFFADAAPGSRSALVVWSSGRFLVEPKVGHPEAIAKEFDVWVTRMKAMTLGSGQGGGKAPYWVGLAKFAGVCAVLFAGMFAYGSYLQANKVQTAGGPNTALPAPAVQASGGTAEAQMRSKVYEVARNAGPSTFETQTNAVIDDNKIASIASVQPDKLKKILASNGLAARTSGDMVFSFSNPTCSACRHLEGELDKLDSGANPVVIPVAFDENSMRLGTAIMCSPDPVSAWKTVMTGGTISTALCEDGLKKMEANSLLFAELGFNATPTIVATDGRAMIGSVAAPALRKWMKDSQ